MTGIVVGVDGSVTGAQALAWAVGEGALHDEQVVAVLAWGSTSIWRNRPIGTTPAMARTTPAARDNVLWFDPLLPEDVKRITFDLLYRRTALLTADALAAPPRRLFR